MLQGDDEGVLAARGRDPVGHAQVVEALEQLHRALKRQEIALLLAMIILTLVATLAAGQALSIRID